MLNHNDIKSTELKLFLDTAVERHFIYLKKESGRPRHWSNDNIFNEWFFCNVFRELDKTSKYIIDNVIEPNNDKPLLWAALIICRYYSRIETIKLLVENDCLFSTNAWLKGTKILKEYYEKGNSICTPGFLTTARAHGNSYKKYLMPFIIVNDLNNRFPNLDNYLKHNTIENITNFFAKNALCTAMFMAYEYASDIVYTKRYNDPCRPTDIDTYCSCTIGSLRGLRRLCGEKYNNRVKINVDDCIQFLLRELKNRFSTVSTYYDKFVYPEIHAREIEHWLCEYDKYSRVLKENRRIKRRYRPNDK